MSKQMSTLDKINNNKEITDNWFKVIFKRLFRPILMMLAGSKVTYKLVKENQYKKIIKRPIIFVANHSCFQDIPIICKALKDHVYVLVGKQDVYPVDQLFFDLNGTVFVDRKDKEDMKLSKVAMKEYLKRGQNILMFPEGSWNLTDDLLVHEMKWGVIDVALGSGAQIIPVSLDYNEEEKKCYIKYGKPILPELFKNNLEAIEYVREALSTLKWEQMERNGIISHDSEIMDKYRGLKEQRISEYPPYNHDYEQSCIFDTRIKYDDVFSHLEEIEPTLDNAFLFNKRNR